MNKNNRFKYCANLLTEIAIDLTETCRDDDDRPELYAEFSTCLEEYLNGLSRSEGLTDTYQLFTIRLKHLEATPFSHRHWMASFKSLQSVLGDLINESSSKRRRTSSIGSSSKTRLTTTKVSGRAA